MKLNMRTTLTGISIALIIPLIHSQGVVYESNAFIAVCNNNNDCNEIHEKAICGRVENTDTSGRPPPSIVIKRCGCDHTQFFEKINDTCVSTTTTTQTTTPAVLLCELGHLCDPPRAICSTPGAVCEYATDQSGLKRCQCEENKIEVIQDGQQICGQLLTTSMDDATCSPCERSGGKCYDTDGDNKRDGCRCPVSKSGDNCQTHHVNVSCADNTMTVCYTPHPEFNFSNGAWMHVDGYGDSVPCRGTLDTEEKCGTGRYILHLSLDESAMKTCGTWEDDNSRSEIKYENLVMIQSDPDIASDGDIVFKVYCTFRTRQELGFVGLHAFGVEDTSVGIAILPGMQMTVENSFGLPIPEGVSLRVGDKVRFRISLDPTSGYDSLRVERCALTPSPDYASFQRSVQVVLHGCPVSDQGIFTLDNNWQDRDGKRHSLSTGLIPMFPVSGSQLSVHLICILKVCIDGLSGECEPVNCSAASTRSKREVNQPDEDVKFVKVGQKLSFSSGSNLDFSLSDAHVLLGICGTVAILLIITIILVVLHVKHHRKQKLGTKKKQGLKLDGASSQHRPIIPAQWPHSNPSSDPGLQVAEQSSISSVEYQSSKSSSSSEGIDHREETIAVRFYQSKFFTNNYQLRGLEPVHNVILKQHAVESKPPVNEHNILNKQPPEEDKPNEHNVLNKQPPEEDKAKEHNVLNKGQGSKANMLSQKSASNSGTVNCDNSDGMLTKSFCNRDELGENSDNFGECYGPFRISQGAKSPLYSNHSDKQKLDNMPNMSHSHV